MSTEKNEFASLFSERIRYFRISNGLSQDKYAEIIGVNKGNVNDAERGRLPSARFIAGIARAFPNDLYYLLTGEKPEIIYLTKGREREERELMDIFRALPHKRQLNLLGMIRPDAIESNKVAKPDNAAGKKSPNKKTG